MTTLKELKQTAIKLWPNIKEIKMTKLQQNIYITATDVECVDGKLIVKSGEFYFQGNKYTIENKEIKGM